MKPTEDMLDITLICQHYQYGQRTTKSILKQSGCFKFSQTLLSIARKANKFEQFEHFGWHM